MLDKEKRGETRRYNLDAETLPFNTNFSNSELWHTAIRKEVKKNWALLCAWVVITTVGIVFSYYLSGWSSVAVQGFLVGATYWVGRRMVLDVITIRHTIR